MRPTFGLDKKTGCDVCEESCQTALDKEQAWRVAHNNTGVSLKEAFTNYPAHAVGGQEVSAVCKKHDPDNQCGSGTRKRCSMEPLKESEKQLTKMTMKKLKKLAAKH